MLALEELSESPSINTPEAICTQEPEAQPRNHSHRQSKLLWCLEVRESNPTLTSCTAT